MYNIHGYPWICVCEHLSLVRQHIPLTRDFCVNVKPQTLSGAHCCNCCKHDSQKQCLQLLETHRFHCCCHLSAPESARPATIRGLESSIRPQGVRR